MQTNFKIFLIAKKNTKLLSIDRTCLGLSCAKNWFSIRTLSRPESFSRVSEASYALLIPSIHATDDTRTSLLGTYVDNTDSLTRLQDVSYGSIELLKPWFPQVDANHPRARTLRIWKSRRDVLLWTNLAFASIVFIVNLVFTILLWKNYGSSGDGTVTVSDGECSGIRHLDSGLHILINFLSTILLGASNLCLQLLLAPTRKEIDTAHGKRRWLDIGVPSFRNLWNLPRSCQIVWLILAFSSIPIHFMYVYSPVKFTYFY